MGRVKLPEGQARTAQGTYRMTNEEAEALKGISAKFGLTVSEFIRKILAPAIASAIQSTSEGQPK